MERVELPSWGESPSVLAPICKVGNNRGGPNNGTCSVKPLNKPEWWNGRQLWLRIKGSKGVWVRIPPRAPFSNPLALRIMYHKKIRVWFPWVAFTIGLLCGGSSPYWCNSMKIDRVRFPAGAATVLLIWGYGEIGKRNRFKPCYPLDFSVRVRVALP